GGAAVGRGQDHVGGATAGRGLLRAEDPAGGGGGERGGQRAGQTGDVVLGAEGAAGVGGHLEADGRVDGAGEGHQDGGVGRQHADRGRVAAQRRRGRERLAGHGLLGHELPLPVGRAPVD